MKTPVIIAAYNEADYIGRTLDALDERYVDPIVVVNGSTDETASIARSYGVIVHELPEPGKLPALQYAVGQLGSRTALDALLFTDADSRPFLTRHWHKIMSRAVELDVPSAATGPIGYIDGTVQDRLLNTYWLTRAAIDGRRNNRPFTTGNNMSVQFQYQDVLDEFMEMPHIWPREDDAIAALVKRRGGNVLQLLDIRSVMLTSTRSAITLSDRLELGGKEAYEQHCQRYVDRAAPGSQRFKPHSKAGY